MDWAHLHLMFSHLPIVGIPLVAAFLAWGLVRRSRPVQRAALGFALLVGAASYPVLLTGEGAEEQLEREAWYVEPTAEEHEEGAQLAVVVTLAGAVLAGLTLVLSRGGRPVRTAPVAATMAALVAGSALFALTGLEGGRIRHDELRDGTVQPDRTEEEEPEREDTPRARRPPVRTPGR